MSTMLVAGALALGLAGIPHCAAMCAAPCAAVVGPQGAGRLGWFHLGRLLSYGLAGALAAASVNALGSLSAAWPWLRPIWSALHAAALGLGLWLLVMGRQPAWLERMGRRQAPVPAGVGGWHRISGPVSATSSGLLWVAWPCGLLQSAILLAALADGPASGAAVMAAFAAASSLGVSAGPALWRALGPRAAGWLRSPAAVRLAGALIAVSAAAALLRHVWAEVAAYCGL